MRGEYEPSDSSEEPFRSPAEISKTIKAIPGFEESVRDCMYIVVILFLFSISLATVKSCFG